MAQGDDGDMSPEELEKLYFGPSADKGPEASWQPPRVPPPPPEPERPTWEDSHTRNERERAEREARIASELAASNAQTARDEQYAYQAELQRQDEKAARRREKEAQREHERALEDSRQRHEQSMERALEDSRQRHEQSMEHDRRHEERMRELTSPDPAVRLSALNRSRASGQPLLKGPPVDLPAMRPAPLGLLRSEPFPSRAETFVLGLAVGALGAAAGFMIRDWWRDRQRR